MWYRKMQNSARKMIGILMIIWMIFAYQLLLHMIPDQVYLDNTDLSGLNFRLPIKFTCDENTDILRDTTAYIGDYHNASVETTPTQVNLTAKLFGIIPVKNVRADMVGEKQLYVSGEVVGLYVKTDGVLVLGSGSFEGKDGVVYEPAKNVLKSGDYICAVDGIAVHTKEELIDAVNQKQGQHVVLSVRRNNETIDLYMQPMQAQDGNYKIGVWVRDDLAGIGTLTYLSRDGEYGALGHAITDMDTGSVLEIEEGRLYHSDIIGVIKGESGEPGSLSGVINYDMHYCMGTITENTEHGIFGSVSADNPLMTQSVLYPVGYKQEISLAPASILCDVDGQIRSFQIEITEVDYQENKKRASISFEVNDPKLLELTGGIVQGMSGSPIIQNGKIIGAVTHVFVQDSTKGYGIFIENMIQH